MQEAMLYIKVIGSIFIIISCAGIGRFYSRQIYARLKNLKELKRCIVIMQNDIRYAGTPLADSFDNVAKKVNGTFSNFFNNVADKLNNFQGMTFKEIWNDNINMWLNDVSLSVEDKENIKSLGDIAGYMDKQTQIENFNIFLKNLDMCIEEVSDSAKEKSKIYNMLGLTAGAFIILILI